MLDVETTSGDPSQGRIIEVAVKALDGVDEKLNWDTLVQPRTPIPPFIRKLTGITDDMLIDAPIFPEVARSLATVTQNRIVVAHNVRYDMTALEHEFARTGMVFDRAALCTERLSRQLVPQLSHYNLGSLCRYFGIPFIARHRAPDDAAATASLLLRLIDAFGEDRILLNVTVVARQLRA